MSESHHDSHEVEDTSENEPQTVEEDDRKIFVGGLNANIDEDKVKSFFEDYGPVEKVQIKYDHNTGCSRGFAFILFKDIETITKVMSAGTLSLGGRTLDPKPAKKREVNTKVFVGGLGRDATDDDIRIYFEKFGKIKEMDLPVDMYNKRRGFCFITYATREGMAAATKDRMQDICGKQCEVKKSVPKNIHQARGGMFDKGGRGGGRGGGQSAPPAPSYAYHPYQQPYGGYGAGYAAYDASYAYGDYYGYGGYGDTSGWGSYDMTGYDYGYGGAYPAQQSSYGKYPRRGARGGSGYGGY